MLIKRPEVEKHFDIFDFSFAEMSGSAPEQLPVVFETTEDPAANNLTRADVNCDKTGTCYDGMFINRLQKINLFTIVCGYASRVCSPFDLALLILEA